MRAGAVEGEVREGGEGKKDIERENDKERVSYVSQVRKSLGSSPTGNTKRMSLMKELQRWRMFSKTITT